MLKDFESEERHLNFLQKAKTKYLNENKKYLLRLEQMKEKKEELINQKRAKLLKKYSKREKGIQSQLFTRKSERQNDNKNNAEILQNKEISVKEKRRRKIEKDEKDRIKIETQIFTKCKT